MINYTLVITEQRRINSLIKRIILYVLPYVGITDAKRRRNNVAYVTLHTGCQNDVETTLLILREIRRRQGDVETTSKFSRSTSRPNFDLTSTSKQRRVPAGTAYLWTGLKIKTIIALINVPFDKNWHNFFNVNLRLKSTEIPNKLRKH